MLHTSGRAFATGTPALPPKPDRVTARLHRDWLKSLPAIAGKPLGQIARDIKVAPSTLYRPLQEGDDGISTLHANTIAKVVAHFGVPPPTDVAGAAPAARRGFGEDAAPFEIATDPISQAITALIGDANGVTPWTVRTRAVELAGILPGDVVLLDLNRAAKPGDIVCGQVYDWQRMRAETVIRLFDRAPPVDLLLPRSLDTGFRAEVIDGERVTVKGVILPHRLRPLSLP